MNNETDDETFIVIMSELNMIQFLDYVKVFVKFTFTLDVIVYLDTLNKNYKY